MKLHETWNNVVSAQEFWKTNENKVFVIVYKTTVKQSKEKWISEQIWKWKLSHFKNDWKTIKFISEKSTFKIGTVGFLFCFLFENSIIA